MKTIQLSGIYLEYKRNFDVQVPLSESYSSSVLVYYFQMVVFPPTLVAHIKYKKLSLNNVKCF